MTIAALKEKWTERFQELSERARQYWMTLNPRERLIVSLLAGVMGLLLVAVVIKQSTSLFFAQNERLQTNLENIGTIQKLIDELLVQKSDARRYAMMLDRRGNDFKLETFVKSEASKQGVTLAKVAPTKPKEAANTKGGQHEWLEIELDKNTSLDSALRFLHEVHQTLGVRLVELNMKPQFADPTKFEVKAIVTFHSDV